MQSRPLPTHDSRTLLVDPNLKQGGQLVEQLNRAGFRTDFAVSWSAARAALGANYYHSGIVVADLDQSADLNELDELRRAALRVWIIVLSDLQPEKALPLAHRQGVDAVLSAPFAMEDLTSRLAAFSTKYIHRYGLDLRINPLAPLSPTKSTRRQSCYRCKRW
jgi:DNA-binding response OmpR family regulator